MTPDFAARLTAALPRLLAPGALPDDWDHRATTYDLFRFDSDTAFAARFEVALSDIAQLDDPRRIRDRLAEVGLPFDYARLGQPLSTVLELYVQSRTNAARVFSFASVTKPWLSVIESPKRTLPVRVYAKGALRISSEPTGNSDVVEFHPHWTGEVPARRPDVITVLVTDAPFTDDIQASEADAICYAVPDGGMLLIRDAARIDPYGIQLIRKRTISALLAADARAELERIAGVAPTRLPEATAAECQTALQALFPQLRETFYCCTGLAAEAAVFTAVGDVLGPVTFFYAQNGYGGTGQLIADLLARGGTIEPRALEVIGHDSAGRSVTLVDRVLASLETLDGAACVFLETPTNPELQVHDFPALLAGLRGYQKRTGMQVPVVVDTTLAPLYPIFEKDFAQGWPFILVKSGSKYFTKGKTTLGVVACADDPVATKIVARARELGEDADSFARPHQLAELRAGLRDLVPRMAAISANTIRLAHGLRTALRARGHEITLYAISEAQVADGLATGMLSFYLPPAPTTYADLVDEFVAYLLAHAPALVKSRVSYGQSTGDGRPDYFYVINPEESTQGALSAEVKNAQKHDNVQICRISVPEHADVDGLLAAMDGFFTLKYAPRYSPSAA